MIPGPRYLAALALASAAGCSPGADAQPVDAALPADAEPSTPQRPPREPAALEAWLAEGHHLSWRCERDIHPPRLTGNHGRHRICSNDLLLGSASGPYPVGAASVKELYTVSGAASGFAVGLKVIEGEGAHTWYWYERRGADPTRPLAEGVGVPDCAVCHGMAPRDYVYLRAPE